VRHFERKCPDEVKKMGLGFGELSDKICEKAFSALGGKENLSPESQHIIREAVELAINEFSRERMLFPRDENTISWVILAKTMTHITNLSLKRDTPIIGFKIVPVSLKTAKGIDTKKIKVALVQIGLSKAAYTTHDTRLGLLFQLKDPAKVSKIIIEALQTRIAPDVSFVCLPELSVPSDENFMGELERVAREREMFVIAGSFHDLELHQNISLIITPYREKFSQYKIRGSDEYGEGLEPQIFCTVKIFDADSVRFAALICSDLMLDSVANLFVYRSMRCQGIDIVFNPSHTGAIEKIHGELRTLCDKVISYIAFVNAEQGGSVVLVPKKASDDNPLMICEPCEPCQLYEVKIAEASIDVDHLRRFRSAYYGISNPKECFVSPSR
jgi:hypothetical protein